MESSNAVEVVTPTLILIPGLAADEAVFQPQLDALPDIIAPAWPKPHAGETLSAYAQRWAEEIDPRQPCVVGGISFGGIVAQEMAKHLNAQACLVISSVVSPGELPRRISVWKACPRIVHLVPNWLLQPLAALLAWCFPRGVARAILKQYARSDAWLLRWSAEQVLRWQGSPCEVPLRRIHGTRDIVFPVASIRGAKVIHGGKHLLTISHPDEVNAFLQETLAKPEPSSAFTQHS